MNQDKNNVSPPPNSVGILVQLSTWIAQWASPYLSFSDSASTSPSLENMLGRTEQVSSIQIRLHWARRLLRYSITARNAAKSALVAPNHLAQDTELSQSSSSSWGCWVASGSGLPNRPGLGPSSTWILKDEYSFSSGPLLGSETKELLGLMARSTEEAENGSLSSWDTSTPGLLNSGPESKLLERLSGTIRIRLPPVVTMAAGASRVSLACLLFLVGGIVLAGALATLAGTLDGIVPAYTELLGNFNGTASVSTVEVIAAVDLELMGNMEDMVFTGTNLLEGTELVVAELLSVVPRQVAALAWSPAPFAKADPVEEEDKEVSADRADTVTPDKRFFLRAVRGRGWKETVGDTGP